MSLGGQLVLVSACLTANPLITEGQAHTHTHTKEDWQHQWRGRRELTSSLESGLHFGHYIAGISSDHISHFHALKATLVLRRGIVLERWARGLSVMLEKMFGCTLITKLQSILLMEADFNATNKIIYGQ